MQRHEMLGAIRALGLKGMAGAFDEAVTTGVQRKRTTPERGGSAKLAGVIRGFSA